MPAWWIILSSLWHATQKLKHLDSRAPKSDCPRLDSDQSCSRVRKLTDIFVESRLMDAEDDRLKEACEEYKATKHPIFWIFANQALVRVDHVLMFWYQAKYSTLFSMERLAVQAAHPSSNVQWRDTDKLSELAQSWHLVSVEPFQVAENTNFVRF